METVSRKQKKAGRPPKVIKKEVRACARFTKSEYFIVKEKAAKAGLNISSYIRLMSITGEIKTRLTAEERGFYRQLVGMAGNINQVAKRCHQEGLLRAVQYFDQFRSQFDDLLKKLKP